MSPSVYVAGSSDPRERDRVRSAVAALTMARVTVVSTWLQVIEDRSGVGNPTDLTPEDRRVSAEHDLSEVARADILLFLVPPVAIPTRGGWGELTYAYSMALDIVCSGQTNQSIFSALGIEKETDAEAIQAVIWLAGGGS